MDHTDLLSRLNEATDEELAAAREDILARVADLRPLVESREVTEDQLQEIETLGEAHSQIREQMDTRDQAAAARADRAGAVLSAVADQPEDGEPEGDPQQPETDVVEEQPVEEREPVAAAARPPLGSATSRARTAPRPNHAQMAIRAAADINGFASGQDLTPAELGRAFAARLQSISRAKGSGELVHVATLASDAPDARKLRKGDLDGNTRRIEAQNPMRALTAAGGLCAPFTPDYSIDVVGSTARPVRDALAGFQAERGGIYFRPNIDGAAQAATASGVWTNADDAAVGTGTPPADKVYATVDCPAMIEAEVEAETFQLEFSNVTARFDPESTAANIQAHLVAHARWAENRLLGKLNTGSTLVTYDQKLGATRDFLAMLDHTLAYYRSLHRIDSSVRLRMILPQWVLDMFRVDLTRALHNSNTQYFAMPDATIQQWFTNRGVEITWHLDGSPTAVASVVGPPALPAIAAQQYGTKLTAGQAIPGFPDQVDVLLFIDGEWLHMDGGTLDVGVVRDSALIGQNRYRMFSEEWLNPVFRGFESLRIVATVQPNGASSGTVDPSSFTD
jgi:hypothetical protein